MQKLVEIYIKEAPACSEGPDTAATSSAESATKTESLKVPVADGGDGKHLVGKQTERTMSPRELREEQAGKSEVERKAVD
jgi:hypothetical protein